MTEKKNWDLIAKIEKQIKEKYGEEAIKSPAQGWTCLLYTSPSPRDLRASRMPSSA